MGDIRPRPLFVKQFAITNKLTARWLIPNGATSQVGLTCPSKSDNNDSENWVKTQHDRKNWSLPRAHFLGDCSGNVCSRSVGLFRHAWDYARQS